MARKSNEIKENEELEKEVVQEATTETPEKVEEIKENEEKETVNSEEVIEEPKQDAKVQENASNTEQEAKVQVTEDEVNKLPTVKEVFKDKYDEKVVYKIGDVFIESEEIEDKKPVKVEDGKYKVSKERYDELKRSLYVD